MRRLSEGLDNYQDMVARLQNPNAAIKIFCEVVDGPARRSMDTGARKYASSNSGRPDTVLGPLTAHRSSAGLGHISEIADGDAPFTPRDCPFQGWSLGEFVRLEKTVLGSRTSQSRRRVPEPQWA